MANRFPSLIEWIDEMTMKELHSLHKENEPEISFDAFVQNEYEAHKQMWNDDMNTKRIVKYNPNEDIDVALDTAKIVFANILNDAIRSGKVKSSILQEELTPDYRTDAHVVDVFFCRIIPAVEKMLNNLND